MINKDLLREKALTLRTVLSKYSAEELVRGYASTLEPLLQQAEQGEIDEPINDNSAWYYPMANGELAEYPDLVEASADFVVELKGGLPSWFK